LLARPYPTIFSAVKSGVRKFLRSILIILAVCVGAVVLLLASAIMISAHYSAKRHQELVNAITGATEIRLQEFVGSTILTNKPVDLSETNALVNAFGGRRGYLPFSMRMCFVPHHRIITTSQSATNEITICFGCDQARLNKGTICDLPSNMHQPVREIFTSRGIPIRPPADYSDLYIPETTSTNLAN
jgi:hypothetical protein